MRARLTVELEGDPGLAEQLRAALRPGPPPVPTHPPTITQSVHIGGNANHSTINVGPLHLKKTAGTAVTLAVIGVVLALLVTLGFRSVAQMLGDDEGERKVAPLTELATVKSVLPGRAGLPAEFKSKRDPVVTTGERGCQPECEGRLFTASTTMARERPQKTAVLYVAAFDSAAHAAQAFDQMRRDRCTTAAGDLEPSLTALGRMMADRAQQAQNGSTPSATASF
ncbi:hypothetical protein [Streptomyces sp. NPDC051183]|uniref:hypothetical protein n=1 Tax=Streptomyces sp. NPDC051183 TaxID=3155165 RepID=UPI003448BFE5